MAVVSISKISLHGPVCVLSTYLLCTSALVCFSSVIHHWESYKAGLVNTVKTMTDVVWSGDGTFDSIGHSAKYGAYTIFCATLMTGVYCT